MSCPQHTDARAGLIAMGLASLESTDAEVEREASRVVTVAVGVMIPMRKIARVANEATDALLRFTEALEKYRREHPEMFSLD